ncbi:hypothetical protein H0H81_005107 [Sphagnurus paluster]|uniref:Uncharacterized protein n=1 Tax=Sphagnurus paluster TaxID=117069 RepID=A0A9P7FMR1_9AGAR|nr:hypothetical protein H0H81_005107 [Sphagnurus paluster]
MSVAQETQKAYTTRSRAKDHDAILVQKALMSPEVDLLWKSAIRGVWKAIYVIDVIADFATYEPADEDAVEAVNYGSGAPPDFKLDFGKGWTSSQWNKLILQKIYKDLLESRQSHGGWNLPDVSEDYVMSMLRGQLKRSREAWAEMQPRFSFETVDFEGEEDTVK